MPKTKSYENGLTIIEVLVSTIIMALIVASLANVFIVGRRLVVHNRTKSTSSELSNVFLENIQMQVRQDQWSSPSTATQWVQNNGIVTGTPVTMSDGKQYNVTYNVTPVGATSLRSVQATVIWNE